MSLADALEKRYYNDEDCIIKQVSDSTVTCLSRCRYSMCMKKAYVFLYCAHACHKWCVCVCVC